MKLQVCLLYTSLTIGLFILEAFYFLLIKQLPPKAARYPYFVLSLMVFLTLLLAKMCIRDSSVSERSEFTEFAANS